MHQYEVAKPTDKKIGLSFSAACRVRFRVRVRVRVRVGVRVRVRVVRGLYDGIPAPRAPLDHIRRVTT